MDFTCLNCLSLSSEAEKIVSSSLTHTGFCVLNSRRGHNEDTSSPSLKYCMQDITVNNYHFISLKIIMLVFCITPFPNNVNVLITSINASKSVDIVKSYFNMIQDTHGRYKSNIMLC